jgi:crotonobetainyl-CoA:carnitine CoA-transferase CaiB-like acyl-CoA transferase
MSNAMVAADAHVAARGVFVDVLHPELRTQRVMRAPWLFARDGPTIWRHGPLMGQDTTYVLKEVLQMDDQAIDSLSDVLR